MHYQRLKKTGSLDQPICRGPEVDRFWAKVTIVGPKDCWLWTGNVDTVYGRFWLDGRKVLAHRYSYELAKGLIPDGLHIDHLCRVQLCVNPAHLEAVTQLENNRRILLTTDLREKRRESGRRGAAARWGTRP
jgi:hypothetical protein